MKYLNLSPGFNPFNASVLNTIKLDDLFTFNGGEPHIKISRSNIFLGPLENLIGPIHNAGEFFKDVTITHRVNSMQEVGEIAMAVDALRNIAIDYDWYQNIFLFVPYFPGARQDRVAVWGEPLTARVYANLFNAMKLRRIAVLDVHSDATPMGLDNCKVISNHTFIERVMRDIRDERKKDPILIRPDSGAGKKIDALAKYLIKCGYKTEIVKADKIRETSTGEIIGTEVLCDNFGGRDVLIPDDICDGGRTFIEIAKVIQNRNVGNKYLAVTHGIFSDGFEQLFNHLDGVYTTDSFGEKFYSAKHASEDYNFHQFTLQELKIFH